MKNGLAIFLAVLFIPLLSFTQSRVDDLMGADNLKRMLQLGLCTKTGYTVHNNVKTVNSVFKYDTNGFGLVWASAFAGSFNTCTYEKDSRGYIAKVYYHEVEDTSKVSRWVEYENDSLGNHIKTTSHTPDGKSHVDEVITSRHDGKYEWHFSTRYNGFDTIKSATRSYYESKSLWMVDYIYYDKNDSIKEIKTHFADYDSLGNLVARGEMDYVHAIVEYCDAHRIDPYIYLYAKPQFIFQLQLDRKLEGERSHPYSNIYHYDSLGRIVETYDSGGKMFYTYNSNNQVVEANTGERDYQPYIIKYEYDQNGLLIRETVTLTKWNTIYTDIVYEYAPCK